VSAASAYRVFNNVKIENNLVVEGVITGPTLDSIRSGSSAVDLTARAMLGDSLGWPNLTVPGVTSLDGGLIIGANPAGSNIGPVDSLTKENGEYVLYDGGDTVFWAIPASQTISVSALSDTFHIYNWYSGGEATDTVLFSINDIVGKGKWEGSYGLTITKVTITGTGTTDIDVDAYHDVNSLDGTPITLFTGANITSTTTGDDITSFTDATLDKTGEFLWFIISDVTTQPTALEIDVYGFKTE
jgi:hypothetical protein